MMRELEDIAVWYGKNMWLGIKSMPKFALETPAKLIYESIRDDIKIIIKSCKGKHS